MASALVEMVMAKRFPTPRAKHIAMVLASKASMDLEVVTDAYSAGDDAQVDHKVARRAFHDLIEAEIVTVKAMRVGRWGLRHYKFQFNPKGLGALGKAKIIRGKGL